MFLKAKKPSKGKDEVAGEPTYAKVPVHPQPCSREEAELHVRAFIESFIAPPARQRWVTRLLETKHRIDFGRVFDHFAEQCVASRCSSLQRPEDSPQRLGVKFGESSGVYFGEYGDICKVTAPEAATLGSENYAIWSLVPGRRALLFLHDGPL